MTSSSQSPQWSRSYPLLLRRRHQPLFPRKLPAAHQHQCLSSAGMIMKALGDRSERYTRRRQRTCHMPMFRRSSAESGARRRTPTSSSGFAVNSWINSIGSRIRPLLRRSLSLSVSRFDKGLWLGLSEQSCSKIPLPSTSPTTSISSRSPWTCQRCDGSSTTMSISRPRSFATISNS